MSLQPENNNMKTIAFLHREAQQSVPAEMKVGYANGYVAVPPGHPLYEIGCITIKESTCIAVSGGVTLAQNRSSLDGWDRLSIEMLDGGSFDDIPGDWWVIGFDTMRIGEGRYHDRDWCIAETRRLQQQIEATKEIERIVIELTKDTMCAHDEHEITKYPRPWFHAKPMLKAGTRLKVEERWTNFYGTYYRCETEDGLYDIPVDNAIIVKEE